MWLYKIIIINMTMANIIIKKLFIIKRKNYHINSCSLQIRQKYKFNEIKNVIKNYQKLCVEIKL